MNIKQRIGAALAASALALTIGFVAAPAAQADYSGNTVTNRSQGWVQVQADNGGRYWLAGYGAKLNNVDYVVVTPSSCVNIGYNRYCANAFQTYMVSLPNYAQIFVYRIS